MTACYHGYYSVAQELLQTRKISINGQNYHGMTALHMAAQLVNNYFENEYERYDICTYFQF